ncbi:MAG TPA: ATP-binding protein [Polyangia bacterium]|nr:ATP-binding protein [Polyangia bacterium]
MRLGVSGKVLLALTALLVAFAGDATFTVLSIHWARQGVLANEAYLDLQGSVDSAWKALNDFAPSLGRNMRLDPNLALAFKSARKQLEDGVAAIDRYLEKEPKSYRRLDFEVKRRQLTALEVQVDMLAAEAGTVGAANDNQLRTGFESHFAAVTHMLNRMRRPLRGESGQIAQRLTDDEETALQMAVGLGIAGLAIAGAAFFFTMRTLRPLGVLRARARAVAGGDYARRTGVASHDEIGDLAREFDVMAGAIEEREQKVIRAERLATVGRMAAQITHEVRNPLSSIGLYAELLGDEIAELRTSAPGDADKTEPKRLVQSIIAEVDRLTEITETYLRFARLPRPKLEREDLGAIVTGVLEFARAELSQAGIALDLRVAPALPEVAADEAQLRQAILNLVRNAREAMAGGSSARLAVVVEGRGDSVVVTMTDSGPGIPAENLAKIFDPFFSTKERGTGLGLALVQEIVVEHAGRIEVGAGEGGGTRFTLTFPALAPDAAPAAGRAPARDDAEERPAGVTISQGAPAAR